MVTLQSQPSTAAATAASSTQQGPKPTPWQHSEAKQILKKDIVEGRVTDEMDPEEVFEMHGGLYHEYEFKNFKTNLGDLKEALKKQFGKAVSDHLALWNDITHRPRNGPTDSTRPCPRWEGSEAERLLKLDMEEGLHEQMRPSDLFFSRPEYAPWPLEVFRDHIYQGSRSELETPYWMAKRAEKEAKRAKRRRRN